MARKKRSEEWYAAAEAAVIVENRQLSGRRGTVTVKLRADPSVVVGWIFWKRDITWPRCGKPYSYSHEHAQSNFRKRKDAIRSLLSARLLHAARSRRLKAQRQIQDLRELEVILDPTLPPISSQYS